MLLKEFIKAVNTVAQTDFNRAVGMLDAYNLLNGASYFFNNKRVVYRGLTNYESDDYGIHDAYANADGKGHYLVVSADKTGHIEATMVDTRSAMAQIRDKKEDDGQQVFVWSRP